MRFQLSKVWLTSFSRFDCQKDRPTSSEAPRRRHGRAPESFCSRRAESSIGLSRRHPPATACADDPQSRREEQQRRRWFAGDHPVHGEQPAATERELALHHACGDMKQLSGAYAELSIESLRPDVVTWEKESFDDWWNGARASLRCLDDAPPSPNDDTPHRPRLFTLVRCSAPIRG
jgi:hypothetical protein